MKLYHVVAMAKNRVIGKNNKMPWHFSSDLKHFKELTMGSTVIMGRKTYESIGKPLPGRKNFVLTRRQSFAGVQEDVRCFDSITSAWNAVQTPKGFIIGGADLYRQTLELADGIYLTSIDAEYEGDVFYPEIPPNFEERGRKTLQENPRLEVIFYERLSSLPQAA